MERKPFLWKASANNLLVKGATGLIEGQNPWAVWTKQNGFDKYGLKFTEFVDSKFFRFDVGFWDQVDAVAKNVNEKGLVPIVIGLPYSGYATGH